MINPNSIQALRDSIDIVDIISSYIPLKKSGANFKGLCPFHGEKTPSFIVSPSKQIFHCFGCGIGGDAIKFVMEYEKLTYPEAIEKVASMVNFTLTYDNNTKHQLNANILNQINQYYKKNLYTNKIAIQYLKNRGVFDNSIEKFELGFAPSSNEVIKFLKSNFINFSEAIQLGILDQNDKGVYARLVDRITFPIYSHTNKLVGFGGRTISNHPAKYINSPQTTLFNKSKLLYGYDKAKEYIFKEKKIIITEGYLDVIMLHQAGFNIAVATLGTALTNEHIPLIARGEPKVILAYDGDAAGINAAFKAAKLLSINKIDGGVVIFQDGLDPADMIKQNKIDQLNSLLSHPIDLITFVINHIIKSYNIKNPLQKEQALKQIKQYLNQLGEIVANSYINLVASLLQISPNLIKLNQTSTTTLPQSTIKIDIAELSLIKTMLENQDLKDIILSYSTQGIFVNHYEEFQIALHNQDDPRIRNLLLSDGVKVFDKEELIKQLQILLIPRLQQQLLQIKQEKNLNFTKKNQIIRNLQEKIKSLKKGI